MRNTTYQSIQQQRPPGKSWKRDSVNPTDTSVVLITEYLKLHYQIRYAATRLKVPARLTNLALGTLPSSADNRIHLDRRVQAVSVVMLTAAGAKQLVGDVAGKVAHNTACFLVRCSNTTHQPLSHEVSHTQYSQLQKRITDQIQK